MRTKVINFFGGPGSGKSATAALLYGALVVYGYRADLIHTANRDCDELLPPAYKVIAEQRYRLETAAEHADIIVCDHPILQSLAYYGNLNEDARMMAAECYSMFDSANILLRHPNELLEPPQSSLLDETLDDLTDRIRIILMEEAQGVYFETVLDPNIESMMSKIIKYVRLRGLIHELG